MTRRFPRAGRPAGSTLGRPGQQHIAIECVGEKPCGKQRRPRVAPSASDLPQLRAQFQPRLPPFPPRRSHLERPLQKGFTRRPRVPSPQDVNEGLATGKRQLRWRGDSATRLAAASALLLATNLLWIIAVVLNVVGPLGSLSAGLLAWLAFVLDIPGVLLLAGADAELTREQAPGWARPPVGIT